MYNRYRQRHHQADTYRRKGFELAELGRYEEAIAAHMKAKEIHEGLEDKGGVAGDITNTALVYEKMGQDEKALQLHLEACAIDEAIDFKPGLRIDYSNLARFYIGKGDIEKALEFQERLLGVLQTIGDKTAEADEYRDRGFIFAELGRYEEAIAAHMKAKEIHEGLEDKGGVAGDITNTALVYEKMGQDEKALQLHLEACAIDEAIDFKPGLRIDYSNLARFYAERGDRKKASYYEGKLVETIAALSKTEMSSGFSVSSGGIKGQISIQRAKKDIYKVGYVLPSPVRPRTSQFPLAISDERLKVVVSAINTVTEIANEARELRTLRNIRDSERRAREMVHELEDLGKALYVVSLPAEVKLAYRQIQEPTAIELGIGDELISYPWELMHDGNGFLCLRHPTGRFVITDGPFAPYKLLDSKKRFRILLVGDPSAASAPYYPAPYDSVPNLPGARTEVETLAARLRKVPDLEITLIIGEGATVLRVINELSSNYDVIHFSGHAIFSLSEPLNSALLLSDGILRAYEIMQCITTQGQPPFLAFVNACESSREEQWGHVSFENQVFGLASSFLRSGVNYIGALWPVHDQPAVEVALDFYDALFSGISLGESLRRARVNCWKRYQGKEIVWASYVLYGDPTLRLEAPYIGLQRALTFMQQSSPG